MRALRGAGEDVPVGDTAWIDDAERIAARPGIADGEALRRIGAGERTAHAVADLIGRRRAQFPQLARVASAIHADVNLARDIERAVDIDGSVRDKATPELAKLRRRIGQLRVSLRETAERICRSFGEDALTTLVGSRHVLVVPRREIRRGTGVVHAASQTGESLYFEPPRLVAMNNDVESLVGKEHAEVLRILRDFGQRVHSGAGRMRANSEAIEVLDAIRARALFSEQYHCTAPGPSPDGTVCLEGARHPVLERILSSEGRAHLVPLDITIAPHERVLVITGPNAGGKTVALKTLGVCALLHQCGIDVPCGQGALLPVFERILVEVGDGQSLESSMSTFTSHLAHLDTMVRSASPDALCLVDEIGQGTDPDEGAALAIATLEALVEKGAAAVATTHFGRIKSFALSTAGVANASMAFDEVDGRPLYRILLGVAGRSRGIETAQRMGFEGGVVARARELLGTEAFDLDDVLARLERERLQLEDQRRMFEKKKEEHQDAIAAYNEKRGAYELTRKQAERKALREAQDVLESARRDVERVVEQIRTRNADAESIREARATIRGRLERIHARLAAPAGEVRPLMFTEAGACVSISPSGAPAGVVVKVDGGRALVEINGRRIRIPVERLYPPDDDAPTTEPAASSVPAVEWEPLESAELDVRGQDRETALAALILFLDRAALTGIYEVKIIHGVGTGVLAAAVRDALRTDQRLEWFREGAHGEGGAGVTVVRFSR